MDAELAWGVAVMVGPVLLGLGALAVYFHRARRALRSSLVDRRKVVHQGQQLR